MFSSRNKKNNVYPCKPQFYYIKVGFKGSKLYRYVFVMTGLCLHYSEVSNYFLHEKNPIQKGVISHENKSIPMGKVSI